MQITKYAWIDEFDSDHVLIGYEYNDTVHLVAAIHVDSFSDFFDIASSELTHDPQEIEVSAHIWE